MKSTRPGWITMFISLVALIVCVALSQTQQKLPEPKNVSTSEESPIAGLLPHGEAKDGLAAFLLCHCARFKVGQPIPLTYGIINIGSRLEWETNLQKAEENSKLKTRVWWLQNEPELRYNYSWFEVTGPGGKNVPYHGSTGTLPNYTAAVVDKFSVVLYHRQFVGSHYPDLRGPLASDPKHLRHYFDLTEPGTYKVRWGYKARWKGGPWTGELMSNEVQIEIVGGNEDRDMSSSTTVPAKDSEYAAIEPIAHWAFEEGRGSTVYDWAGNNDGIVHGAKWTTGRVGRALSFDGVNDHVDCGNDPVFDITGPITLMAWLKTSSGSSVWQGIVTKGEVLWKIQKHVGGSGDFECWGLIGAPRPGPYLSTVGVNMNDGQWHHIAGTYDGAAMRIYWDGVLNNSLSVSGTINTGSDPVYIGGVYGKPKYGFPGIIDEVAIYDRALSAKEIRQLYKYGSPDQVKQSLRKPAEPLASFVTMTAEGVMFEFRPPVGSSGWLDTELYEHGGEMLTAFSRPHSGEPVLIWLAVPVDQNDPAKYYLRYRIRITAAPLPKWRVIGLSRMPRTTNKTSDKNTPSTPVPAKDMGVKILMSHGPVKDGLAAFLICERKQFRIGQPIPVLYGVVYGGHEKHMTIQAPYPAWAPNLVSWFSVRGPDGKDIPYTGPEPKLMPPNPKNTLRLRRHGFCGIDWPDIRWGHKLSKPGAYTIKWNYRAHPADFWWQGELVSNEIQIEILP